MILLSVTAYVLLQLGIAVWAARGTDDDADYLVAGRTLGPWAIGLSLFATWFAAETVLATTAEVAANGLAGARADPFAYAAGLAVLGVTLAGPLRRTGVVTIADLLGRRYGPRCEAIGTGLVMLSSVVWAGAQLFAFSVVFSGLTGLGFAVSLGFVTALVLIYTLAGGLKGDVVTDAVQGTILAGGVLLLGGAVWAQAGGAAALAGLPPERLTLRPPGEPLLSVADLWVVPVLGTLVSQEAVSRVLAARDVRAAQAGALLGAGLYLAVGGVPVLIGLLAPSLGLVLPTGDGLLPALASDLLPTWAYVVLVGALLSAILSSVDSALLATAAVATRNVVLRRAPDLSSAARLRVARLATLGAGAAAVLVAVSGESLRGLVLEASAIAGLLLVPVVAAVATRRAGARAALASLTVSSASYAVLGWGVGVPGAFLVATAAGLLAYAAAARRPGDRKA